MIDPTALPNDIKLLKKMIILQYQKNLQDLDHEKRLAKHAIQEKKHAVQEKKPAVQEKKHAVKEKLEVLQEKKVIELKYLKILSNYESLRRRFFGRSSEKMTAHDQQLSLLFNEIEVTTEKTYFDEKDEVEYNHISYKRKKKKGRKAISEKLPRKEVIIDLSEEEKKSFLDSGFELKELPSQVTELIEYVPAATFVKQIIQKKYAVIDKNGNEEENQIVTAFKPPQMIPGSIAGTGLLSTVIVNKYCDHLPLYRQEKIFSRIGAPISRQDMSNWVLSISKKLEPLVNLIQKEIRSGPLIHMDETGVQVLNEPGKTNSSESYMWVSHGGIPGKSKAVLYKYHRGRSHKIPKNFLHDYKGFLQTDGYSAYNTAVEFFKDDVSHLGCLAHARRKFFEAWKEAKQTGSSKQALDYIKSIYKIEKKLRNELDGEMISIAQFKEKRIKQTKPIFKEFEKWLIDKKQHTLKGFGLGKAVNYTLNQWDKLIRYVDCPWATPDNNMAENAIRPFVVGRKNWLFSNSPKGAFASANLYSIIETAKLNGHEPWFYLKHLFDHLPTTAESDLESLLPWNLCVDDYIIETFTPKPES